MDNDQLFMAIRGATLENSGQMEMGEAVASSAVNTAMEMGASMIVVLTETGTTARLVAKYRPACPLLVLTALQEVGQQCAGLLRGAHVRVLGSMIGTDSILARATDIGKSEGWVKAGDTIVAVHGVQEARSGATNMLKVIVVT
jgi:pyruvate kinase